MILIITNNKKTNQTGGFFGPLRSVSMDKCNQFNCKCCVHIVKPPCFNIN